MINNQDSDSLLFMVVNGRNRLDFIDKKAVGNATVNVFAEGHINLSIEELGKRIRDAINQISEDMFLNWYKLKGESKIGDCIMNDEIIPM